MHQHQFKTQFLRLICKQHENDKQNILLIFELKKEIHFYVTRTKLREAFYTNEFCVMMGQTKVLKSHYAISFWHSLDIRNSSKKSAKQLGNE